MPNRMHENKNILEHSIVKLQYTICGDTKIFKKKMFHQKKLIIRLAYDFL